MGKVFRPNVGNLAASNVATLMGRTALTDGVVRNVIFWVEVVNSWVERLKMAPIVFISHLKSYYFFFFEKDSRSPKTATRHTRRDKE